MKRNVVSIAAIGLVAFCAVSFSGCRFGLYPGCFGEAGPDVRFVKEEAVLAPADCPDPDDTLSTPFSFVVYSDTHFGSPKGSENAGLFMKFMEEALNDPDPVKNPLFMVCLGDIADYGQEAQYAEYNELTENVKELARNSLSANENFKSYGVLGNHDLYRYGWENWRNMVYPHVSSYCFGAGGAMFYVVDTANSVLGNKQFKFIEEQMNLHKPTVSVVFSHYPLYEEGTQIFKMQDSFERNALMDLYAKSGVIHVFEGHAHKNKIRDFGAFKEQLIGSMRYTGNVVYCTIYPSENRLEQKIINLYDYQ